MQCRGAGPNVARRRHTTLAVRPLHASPAVSPHRHTQDPCSTKVGSKCVAEADELRPNLRPNCRIITVVHECRRNRSPRLVARTDVCSSRRTRLGSVRGPMLARVVSTACGSSFTSLRISREVKSSSLSRQLPSSAAIHALVLRSSGRGCEGRQPPGLSGAFALLRCVV